MDSSTQRKREMTHKLLSGRNDPGAESMRSLEEVSILEVVVDLEPCEPQVRDRETEGCPTLAEHSIQAV